MSCIFGGKAFKDFFVHPPSLQHENKAHSTPSTCRSTAGFIQLFASCWFFTKNNMRSGYIFLNPEFLSPVYSLHEYLNRVRLHYYRWQNTTLLSIFFLSHISLLLQSAVCSRRHLQRHHWHIHLSPDTLIHTPQRKASHSLSHSCVSYQYKDGVLFPVLMHQAYFIGLDLDLS